MARMVVVWCPDWPVVAAGAPPDSLTAVVHANRVVACSEAARAEGVRPGLRRREAQSRCPELELLASDHTALQAGGGLPGGGGGPGDRWGGLPVDRGGRGDRQGGLPVGWVGCRV